MSFSSIAVEQRSKEAQALRLFLGYSLVGSLALHIAVLASGIGNFLARVPTEQEEPIEVIIADTPPEVEKTPVEEVKEPPDVLKPIQRSISQPAVNTARNEVAFVPQPKLPTNSSALAPTPVQKLVEKPQIQPVQRQPRQTVDTSAEKPVTATKPEVTNQSVLTAQPESKNESSTVVTSPSTTQTSITTQPANGQLASTLRGLRDSRGSVGNSSGTSGGSTGSSTGTSRSTTTDNSTGSSEPVAVAPKPPKIEAPASRSNGNGRAACRQCDSKYPEQARRRGIEGRVGVAVDTDANGNVTNVRLTRSSGNRELDEAHLRQAREWKLKPSESGRQGVAIETDYAMRGSRRYREAQERKRQRQAREAEQRTQPTTTANQDSTSETPRRRRRLTTGTIVDVPPESRPRQRRESAAASENPPLRRRLRQRVNSDTPQPRPAQAATSSGENNAAPVQRRRRRRPDPAASSDSGTRLRNALRRSRQPSESAPATE